MYDKNSVYAKGTYCLERSLLTLKPIVIYNDKSYDENKYRN